MTRDDQSQLLVRVNDEFVLDAGTCVDAPGETRAIQPPATTIFRQLLEYLKSKPDPDSRVLGSRIGREGIAATAMTLRWGSYLAVLLDREKSVWAEVKSTGISRISDGEMARINIEASAALAEWIDLYREVSGASLYMKLVDRAIHYLPMPKRTAKPKATAFGALAVRDVAERLIGSTDSERVAKVRANADCNPTRLFANALVNVAWRNGPVEGIHAGSYRGYPIDQRRITAVEERKLLNFANERIAFGMDVCSQLKAEPYRSWNEQVLPYGLAEILSVTPSGWTLTESSRKVWLPA